ncbi:MAG: 6-bladed beta-propeller [Bacteroidota bacterium]|nr:6-bladed beta-propeller [Bacteroidota bacterium]
MKNSVLLILLLLLFYGCNRNPGGQLQLIDLSGDTSTKDNIHLSDISDNVEIVFLETNDSCLIGNIWDIEVTDNFILIVDQSMYKMLLFARDGKFITKVGTRGHGPGEYVQVVDCCFNSNGEEIMVLCNAPNREMHVYDLNGKFIDELPCENLPSRISSFNSKLYYHHGLPSSQFDNDGYSLGVLDNSNIKQLFKRPDNNPGMALAIHKSHFTEIGNQLSFWEMYYDTVYYIDEQSQIVPRFAINHKENYIYANGLIPIFEQSQSIGNSTVMLDLLDCKDYIFIKMAVERKFENVIYDKSQECLYHIGDRLMINDIAGPIKFWPFKTLKNNLICSVHQMNELKESGKDIAPITHTDSRKNSSFWRYVDSASLYDNQCLLFINLNRKNTKNKCEE